jgi:tyrosyl-tRNA synthetase
VDFDVSELLDGDGEVDLVKAIFQAGLTGSASEARRLISQGGVKLNADRVESFKRPVKDGDILQVGKKSFIRLKYDNKP